MKTSVGLWGLPAEPGGYPLGPAALQGVQTRAKINSKKNRNACPTQSLANEPDSNTELITTSPFLLQTLNT